MSELILGGEHDDDPHEANDALHELEEGDRVRVEYVSERSGNPLEATGEVKRVSPGGVARIAPDDRDGVLAVYANGRTLSSRVNGRSTSLGSGVRVLREPEDQPELMPEPQCPNGCGDLSRHDSPPVLVCSECGYRRAAAYPAIRERAEALEEAGLSEREAEVMARTLEGWSNGEIADDLDMAVGSVDSLRHRARKKRNKATNLLEAWGDV